MEESYYQKHFVCSVMWVQNSMVLNTYWLKSKIFYQAKLCKLQKL